jgi:replication factor C large subunit
MNWNLLKYVYTFSSVGVALAKEEKYSGWTRYQYPSKIKKMGQSRAARNRMEAVGKKIGEKMHISLRESAQLLPFLSMLIEDNPDLADQLELDEDEEEFVKQF